MNGVETRAGLPRLSAGKPVMKMMHQASGRCPHCLQHKVARSHFGTQDAEQRLEAMFTACRRQRERLGLTVGE